VIAAPAARLADVKGMGEASITEIKIVQAAARRLLRGELKKAPGALVLIGRARSLPQRADLRREGGISHSLSRQAQKTDC